MKIAEGKQSTNQPGLTQDVFLHSPTPTPSAIPSPKPPVYNNGTVPVVPSPSHTIGTVTRPAPPAATTPTGTSTSTPPIVTAGAGKVAALSGAGLAGLLGVAAFVL